MSLVWRTLFRFEAQGLFANGALVRYTCPGKHRIRDPLRVKLGEMYYYTHSTLSNEIHVTKSTSSITFTSRGAAEFCVWYRIWTVGNRCISQRWHLIIEFSEVGKMVTIPMLTDLGAIGSLDSIASTQDRPRFLSISRITCSSRFGGRER